MQLYPFPFLLLKLDEPKQMQSADSSPGSDWSGSTQITVNMAKTGSFAVLRHNASLYRIYPVISRDPTDEQVTVTLGRLVSNDIVIAEASISKVHASFNLEPGVDATITDLGSRNGTTVNGRRVQPHTPLAISFGDPIVVGGVAVTLIGAGALWEIIHAQITPK
jgi:pSer/pThr/pTyr-binding forkhead associated (FHA) protein